MTVFFADNTVLVNFGHIGHFALLRIFSGGKGAWTMTIAQECAASSTYAGLSDLIDAPQIFGQPLSPATQQEWVDLLSIQNRLAGPGDSPQKHLGEAETLSIMSNRASKSVLVTDDRGAMVEAQNLGIPVMTTADVLRILVRSGQLSAQDAWASVLYLRRLPRGVPRAPLSEGEFMSWVRPAR